MITLEPIGYVRSTRREPSDDDWDRETASIELVPGLPPAVLDGLADFSHAEVIYHFHLAPQAAVALGARHPRGNTEWPAVGIFAQRAKDRPNHLGTAFVRILGCEGARVLVSGLDAIDGTPVLDIKPVMAEFLPRGPVRQPPWSVELMRNYWRSGVVPP